MHVHSSCVQSRISNLEQNDIPQWKGYKIWKNGLLRTTTTEWVRLTLHLVLQGSLFGVLIITCVGSVVSYFLLCGGLECRTLAFQSCLEKLKQDKELKMDLDRLHPVWYFMWKDSRVHSSRSLSKVLMPRREFVSFDSEPRHKDIWMVREDKVHMQVQFILFDYLWITFNNTHNVDDIFSAFSFTVDTVLVHSSVNVRIRNKRR